MEGNSIESAMETSYSCRALALISSSNLPHPDKPIVQVFVEDAIDPELSAHYLLKRVGWLSEAGKATPKNLELFQFLTDWTTLLKHFQPTACTELPRATKAIITARDGARCCITGARTRFFGRRPLVFTCIVSPSALSGLERASSKHLDDILDAFITPAKREWLSSHFEQVLSSSKSTHPPSTYHLDNIWLLSPAVHKVFLDGNIRLSPQAYPASFGPLSHHYYPPSSATMATRLEEGESQQDYALDYCNVRPCPSFSIPRGMEDLYSITLKNRCPGLSPLPNPGLLEIHAHFARGLTWMAVAEQMKGGWHSAEGPMTILSSSTLRLLKYFWLKMPLSIRTQTYLLLRRVGNYFYGSNTIIPGAVTRLPFNLYLKFGVAGGVGRGIATAHANQARAMELVERYTQIPAPRTIDLISTPKYSFLLMTRAPGTPLGPALHRMTNAEIIQLVEDLRRCLWQMRCIPNPYGPQSTICSAHGEGCFDYRMNNSTYKDNLKFESEAKFNEYLLSEVPESEHEKAAPVLSIPHQICFAHGDLNMRNILVDRGRLSGIVDWENAGWLPEYWDYTKIHYTNKWMRRFLDDVVGNVFPDYKKELENERFLWQWVREFG